MPVSLVNFGRNTCWNGTMAGSENVPMVIDPPQGPPEPPPPDDEPPPLPQAAASGPRPPSTAPVPRAPLTIWPRVYEREARSLLRLSLMQRSSFEDRVGRGRGLRRFGGYGLLLVGGRRADRGAGVGVEEVDVVAVGHDADRRADGRLDAGRSAEVDELAGERHRDQRLVAERLDDVHLAAQRAGRVGGDEPAVLGPEAEPGPPVDGLVAQGHGALRVGERPVRDLAVEHVHRRRPAEARDEEVDRTGVEVGRGGELLQAAVVDDGDHVG